MLSMLSVSHMEVNDLTKYRVHLGLDEFWKGKSCKRTTPKRFKHAHCFELFYFSLKKKIKCQICFLNLVKQGRDNDKSMEYVNCFGNIFCDVPTELLPPRLLYSFRRNIPV